MSYIEDLTSKIKIEFGDINEEKYDYNIIQKKLTISSELDGQKNVSLIDGVLKKLDLCSYYFQNYILFPSHYCFHFSNNRYIIIWLEKRNTWLIKEDYETLEKCIEIEKYYYEKNAI